jgi:hypothetical protein
LDKLKINDVGLTDELTSTTLVLERDGEYIMLSLYPTVAPEYPGESILLSNETAMKLYKHLGTVLGITKF